MESVLNCWLDLRLVLHLEFLPDVALHNNVVSYGKCFVLNIEQAI